MSPVRRGRRPRLRRPKRREPLARGRVQLAAQQPSKPGEPLNRRVPLRECPGHRRGRDRATVGQRGSSPGHPPDRPGGGADVSASATFAEASGTGGTGALPTTAAKPPNRARRGLGRAPSGCRPPPDQDGYGSYDLPRSPPCICARPHGPARAHMHHVCDSARTCTRHGHRPPPLLPLPRRSAAWRPRRERPPVTLPGALGPRVGSLACDRVQGAVGIGVPLALLRTGEEPHAHPHPLCLLGSCLLGSRR